MNKSKQRGFKKYGSILFSILFLLIIILFFKKNSEILFSLENLRVSDILIIAILQPFIVAITALINKLIIDEMGVIVSFKDNFFLQFVNTLLNKIIAEGGAVYRGAYLKTQFSFPISSFFASIGGAYIITLLVNSVIGLIFSFIIFLTTNVINYYIVLLFFITTMTTIILIILTPKFNGSGWFLDRLNLVLMGWNQIKRKPKLIVTIIILTLTISLLQSVTILIAYRGLDANIGYLNTIFYSSLSTIANFINITPGGLGINEGFLMFSNKVIGLPIDIILLGALLVRAINLIVSMLFGGVSYVILQMKFHKNLNNN